MFDAIARVLAFFYSLPVVGGSYGWAIILLTGAVMVLLMPLTLRATRSMIRMQEVQPKLKELQRQHKDDKQTLNAEMMALYQQHGINPVGGCLPMVAQLPVFLVLFRVLSGLSTRLSDRAFFSISNHARVEVGGQALDGDLFDPSYLSHESQMYRDLSQVKEMGFGPFELLDLASHPLDVIRESIVAGLPYVGLILFVVFTSFYQQRQVAARRNGQVMMNPQQEMLLKVLPLMSGIWSFVFPAGLVLYWATSNVFRIGQQAYITRAFYNEKADAAAVIEAEEVAVDPVDREKKSKEGGRAGEKESAATGTKDGVGDENGSSGEDAGATDGRPTNAGGRWLRRKGPVDGGVSAAASSANGSGNGSTAEREQAWAQRRQEKARAQSGKKRTEESSRVTPKGTKPGGTKKKRKR